MERRSLGKGGLKVSVIGFGCIGLNFSYGHALARDSIKLIRQAEERGVIFFLKLIAGVKKARPEAWSARGWLPNLSRARQRARGRSRRRLAVAEGTNGRD
jgi:hypothetical protein